MYRNMFFFLKTHLCQLLSLFLVTSLGCHTLKQTCQNTSLPNICQRLEILYKSNQIPFHIPNPNVCSWDEVTCNPEKNQVIGLNLRYKGLKVLPPGFFAGLSQLQKLFLGGNQLTTLPPNIFASLSQLQDLDLTKNRLSSLPDGIFDKLSQLQWLNLEENRLSSLSKGIFASLSQLQYLDLEENPFPAGFNLDEKLCGQVSVIPDTLCP